MLSEVIRGDTLIIEVSVYDSDGKVFDLTNATLTFTVKSRIDDPDSNASIQISQTDHIDAKAGKTIIKVPAELTQQLAAGKTYLYDIQLKKDDIIATINIGSFKVVPDITRSI